MTIVAPNVYVKETGTARGRGGYASRAHVAGELVESCPVLLFSGTFAAVPAEVRQILFNWGVLTDGPSCHCLALGYGSMYNHENPSNMRYEADPETRTLNFFAVRAIGVNEELTINYNSRGGGHESQGDSWFSGHEVQRISSAEPKACIEAALKSIKKK